MRFTTLILGFLAAGISAVAVPISLEQRQVLSTRGEGLANDARATVGRGEEETADEDITWNVEASYPPRPASE